MSDISTSCRMPVLGHLLQIVRTATLERMTWPDIDGKETDERIMLESHLVKAPTTRFTASLPRGS